MSKKRIIGSTILAVMVMIGTYVYFHILDLLSTNLGINLSQTVNLDVSTWQFTVWMMSILLSIIIVFHGIARGHANLEPIAAAAFLTFTIVSYFIGCTIITLGFPYAGFGTLNVHITIDPTKLIGMMGGGGGGGSITIPPITFDISLIQLLVISMATLYAVLLFLRTLLKSRREPESYSMSTKTSKSDISYTPMSGKKEDGSMDFMKSVRKE
ncbi:MAG TPA: hypothetical protein VKM55_06500 [Candidatus Lokiarchaeia archaeon]|nr:hypothetical protein [Candidatus Lokiarchaeia archaeon]